MSDYRDWYREADRKILAVRTAALTGERSGMVTAASMLLLVVFGLKAATFPLTYWLPDCYPVVPAGVIGYIAGLLTKVGEIGRASCRERVCLLV